MTLSTTGFWLYLFRIAALFKMKSLLPLALTGILSLGLLVDAGEDYELKIDRFTDEKEELQLIMALYYPGLTCDSAKT
ncbi:MAG: hypothetical protein TE42_01035 [Candidatus Synechococcus spongiarum SP3]|uniref:Uncharacterized protein n=1 Tax=Candidatus Synechococcus spongiarum SP3 TaxID=1604020 RepID=A0A0G2HNP0_9SYNE|nr:MAG: hypothetical protein TE42_01035 [Candidatus Synechococcus spongiarum SP3]